MEKEISQVKKEKYNLVSFEKIPPKKINPDFWGLQQRTEKRFNFSSSDPRVFMIRQIFFQEGFIPEKEGSLSVRDLSILRGYGIFDYFKTLKGRPLFLEHYLNRFTRSAKAMHLPLSYSKDDLTALVYELLRRNGFDEDTGIRMLLSGGISMDSMSIGKPQLIMMQEGLPVPQSSGLGRLKSYPYQREASHIKSINYGLPIRLRAEGILDGYTDVIYFTENGISETSRCNVFMVKNSIILTPSKGILYGVTRGQVIQCAKEAGFTVKEQSITLTDLLEADECFITSTTKGILPIESVDDAVFPSHDITIKLQRLFLDWCMASL